MLPSSTPVTVNGIFLSDSLEKYIFGLGKIMSAFLVCRFHRKDVLDLQWSTDGEFLVSGSVDNSCIIWDVSRGKGGNG